MVSNKFTGIWLPAKIIRNSGLSLQEAVILSLIYTLDNGAMHCYATNAQISECCMCSGKTVVRAIASLKDKGLISIDGAGTPDRRITAHLDIIPDEVKQEGQNDPVNKVKMTRNNILDNKHINNHAMHSMVNSNVVDINSLKDRDNEEQLYKNRLYNGFKHNITDKDNIYLYINMVILFNRRYMDIYKHRTQYVTENNMADFCHKMDTAIQRLQLSYDDFRIMVEGYFAQGFDDPSLPHMLSFNIMTNLYSKYIVEGRKIKMM